jgi:hypothetical protein
VLCSDVLNITDVSALLARGLAADAGRTTIPKVMQASSSLRDLQSTDVDMPCWGWPASE